MSNSVKVAEIFEQASIAFGRLAQMTMELRNTQNDQENNTPSVQEKGKWTSKEIQDLRSAVQRFGTDLARIAECIESKSEYQIKKKLYEQETQINNSRISEVAKPVQLISGGRRKQAFIPGQPRIDEPDERGSFNLSREIAAHEDEDYEETMDNEYIPRQTHDSENDDYYLES